VDTNSARPVIFRNSRFFIAWLILFGAAAMVIGLAMTLVALYEILTPRHSLLLKALNAILWASAAFNMAWLGVIILRAGVQMTYYEARLDGRGVDFRLGSRKEPYVQFFSWDQIAAVKHERMPTDQYYAVIGKDHRVAEFTMYTFFRAKKLARQIAARAGQSIEEIVS
jgi:hypothetical protein